MLAYMHMSYLLTTRLTSTSVAEAKRVNYPRSRMGGICVNKVSNNVWEIMLIIHNTFNIERYGPVQRESNEKGAITFQ